MPNAVLLLEKDHGRLRALLSELANTTDRAAKRRQELVGEIEEELKTHAQIEEEIFYPAFKKAAKKEDQDLYYEAAEEHHVVDMVLPELKNADPKSKEFKAKAKVLKELIEHHAEEEEEKMFPKARRIFTAKKLAELGDLMAARRETILATWKNPITRPLKKLQGALQARMPTVVKNAKASAIAAAMPSPARGSKKSGGGSKSASSKGAAKKK